MSFASAQATTTASKIARAPLPLSSGLAARRRSSLSKGMVGFFRTIHTDQGSRTQLKPIERKVSAILLALWRCSPPTTPSFWSAPLQFTQAISPGTAYDPTALGPQGGAVIDNSSSNSPCWGVGLGNKAYHQHRCMEIAAS
eukprot:CAMPEP_0180554054 /NCGR_PEP_ID=MMETSP1036_2-20121128/74721_1 /TAXON_ID=632150 /ORGANISM="Azadinium spinosum, Strain 3D9" /LENGTH=140 /DNA_ID=CAMNT_0022569843 /DNA_START=1158 /DNA_END=1578 /DNA_ORIENTATION=+